MKASWLMLLCSRSKCLLAKPNFRAHQFDRTESLDNVVDSQCGNIEYNYMALIQAGG